MSYPLQLVAIAILSLWLLTLTIIYWRILSHYNRLTKGVHTKSLAAILSEMLHLIDAHKKDIEIVQRRCDTIEKESLLSLQKIGLLRFNPFKDTGGEQSFILSLLNGTNTGIVISALYSRSGTRWYAKKVVEGKGIEVELSDEEKKALKETVTRVPKQLYRV